MEGIMNRRFTLRPEVVFVVGTIITCVALLLPWFSVSIADSVAESTREIINTTSRKGNDVSVLWAKLPAMLLIIVAAIAMIRRSPTIDLPRVDLDRVFVVLAGLALVLVALKVMIGEDFATGGIKAEALEGVAYGRSYGLFVALAGAAIAFAATLWNDRLVVRPLQHPQA
jgi:hypothetical protein